MLECQPGKKANLPGGGTKLKCLVLFILVLVVLVDLADDGCFGSVRTGPLQAAVSVAFRIFPPRHPSRQVDPPSSLPSPDWRGLFSLKDSPPVLQEGQQAPKMITSCNNGCSGGIPL
jgi:hypothetical protein